MKNKDRKTLIGLKVRKYRKKRGYTQEKLCELLNIDVSSFSDLENGKVSPSVDKLCDIMAILKINPYDLFDFIEYEDIQEIQDNILIEKIKSLSQKDKKKVLGLIELIKK